VRPSRSAPEPVAEAVAAAETPAEPAADSTATDDAVAEALAAELAVADSGDQGGNTAPAGPPMSSGEKDALRVAVERCWNVAALSTEALRTTVTVAVSVGRDGTPEAASVRMIGSSGGSDAAARQAYEVARRAILRCGSEGFPLPPEKYDTWKDLELVFNSNGIGL
jgi:hypothetical protein